MEKHSKNTLIILLLLIIINITLCHEDFPIDSDLLSSLAGHLPPGICVCYLDGEASAKDLFWPAPGC